MAGGYMLFDDNGSILMAAGPGGHSMRPGGTLEVNTTAVGNVGTGEDDLMSFVLLGNTLNNVGDHIDFNSSGTIGASVLTNKRIRIYVGSVNIFDSTSLLLSLAGNWSIEGRIIKHSSTQIKANCVATYSGNLSLSPATISTPETTLDLTANQTIRWTGTATNNNDVVQSSMVLRWFPDN